MQPMIILSIRNPYDYWSSLFRFAKSGNGAVGMQLRQQNLGKALNTFDGFMRYSEAKGRHYSLSNRVEKMCGRPCVYNFLLRTETLKSDWTRLLTTLQIPSAIAPLAVDNRNNMTNATKGYMVVLTPAMRNIINDMEAWVFQTFNYSME